MFVFGHVGIGRALVRRWRDPVPALPLLIGTLLPDLIDKPLYYARIWDFISCTRTLGHTGLLLLILAGAAYARRSRPLAALAAGMATHLLLDCVIEWPDPGTRRSALTALLWPLMGRDFALSTFSTVSAHVTRLIAWPVIAGEVAGLLLIGFELWQRRATAPLAERKATPEG